MECRETELRRRIQQVTARMREIQRGIAGTRQPATAIELETLEQLGRSYAELRRQLEDRRPAARGEDSEP
jgi:hypothetical protein